MTIAPDSSDTSQAGGPGSSSGQGLSLSSWDAGFLASVLVVLAGSIVPLTTSRWGLNLWGTTNLFFLGIGVLAPLAAAGLILARAAASGKSAGDAGPRLGSLSTEQFTHVTAWLALSYFFITFVTTLDPVLLIGLAGAFGLVVTSPMRALMAPLVARPTAPGVPTGGSTTPYSAQFGIYPSTTAAPSPAAAADGSGGPVADAAAAPEADAASGQAAEYDQTPAYGQAASQETHEDYRSSPEPSESSEPGPDGTQQSAADIDDELGMTRVRPRSTDEAAASATAAFGAPATDSTSTVPAAGTGEAAGTPAPRGTEPAEYEAFWFAVGTRRTAVDPEDGSPAFALEPGGWILALEDRGHEFLVQNTDGRTGVLEDLTDIERA